MNGRIKITVSFLFIPVLMLRTAQSEIQGEILNAQVELGKPCELQCRVVNGTKADRYIRWKENERFVWADPSIITTSVYRIENFTEDYLLSRNVSCIYEFQIFHFKTKWFMEKFIYFPYNKEVSYSYLDANTTVRLEVIFPKVYPRPLCSFYGEDMVADFFKDGPFFSGRYYLEWPLKDFRCTGQQPDCLLKDEPIPNTAMQTNCYEVMNQSYFTVFIAAVFYLIVVISLLGFVRKYYKKPTRETDNLIHSSKTFIQYLSAFATLIGNPFLYGYNMAVLNNPAVIIAFSVMSEDDTSILKTVKQFRDSKTYNLKWSFIVAAYVFTGSIGVLIANNIAMKFGRKKPLMLNSLVVIIASCLLLGIKGAPTLLQQYLLLFYRAVIGISCGIGLVISGMYTMEVSRLTVNSVNGSYGTYNRWFQFYITLGIAVASFLGLDMVLGNKDWWLYLLGFNAIPATCNLLLFFGPDSPIFVYFKTKDVVKMGNELSKICTKDELPAKIDIVKKAAADFESIGPTQFSSIRNLLKDTTIRSKLVLVCILQAAQQLSGINVIFGYSSFIYQRSGVLFEIAEWTVFLTASINCFSTFITLANKQDRKKLIVGSTICMGSAMFFLFFTNKFCHDYHVICPLLAITFVSMFVVAFSVGLGPIPYLEIQEKFEDQKTQGAVFTLSLAINWGCNFLVLIFFRILQLWMESYVYLLFTFMIFSISLYIGCCNREPLQSGNREPLQSGNRESRDSEIGEMRPLKKSTMSDFSETSSSNIDSTE